MAEGSAEGWLRDGCCTTVSPLLHHCGATVPPLLHHCLKKTKVKIIYIKRKGREKKVSEREREIVSKLLASFYLGNKSATTW